MIFGVVGAIGLYVPLMLIYRDILDVPIGWTLIAAICHMPNAFLSLVPVMVFMVVYGSIVCSLTVWADELTRRHWGLDLIEQCQDFLEALDSSMHFFSSHLFTIICLVLISGIFIAYRIVAFFFEPIEFDPVVGVLITGYAAMFLVCALPLSYFAFVEHELNKSVKKLVCTLINHNSTEAATIVQLLQQYQGFPALDFFYVNKTSLCTIFTTTVAYLIILLQFRESECSK